MKIHMTMEIEGADGRSFCDVEIDENLLSVFPHDKAIFVANECYPFVKAMALKFKEMGVIK